MWADELAAVDDACSHSVVHALMRMLANQIMKRAQEKQEQAIKGRVHLVAGWMGITGMEQTPKTHFGIIINFRGLYLTCLIVCLFAPCFLIRKQSDWLASLALLSFFLPGWMLLPPPPLAVATDSICHQSPLYAA
jgi:hypothetical protein